MIDVLLLSKQAAFVVRWESEEIFIESGTFKKTISATESMGNLSLGIGLAAGAGYYLYRKFTGVNEQEENSENSASQVTAKTRSFSQQQQKNKQIWIIETRTWKSRTSYNARRQDLRSND